MEHILSPDTALHDIIEQLQRIADAVKMDIYHPDAEDLIAIRKDAELPEDVKLVALISEDNLNKTSISKLTEKAQALSNDLYDIHFSGDEKSNIGYFFIIPKIN